MAKKQHIEAAPAPTEGNSTFKTDPGHAHDSDGNNALTSGLNGIRSVFPDGSEVIDASEKIEAHYDGRDYGPDTAHQTRSKKNGIARVHQENYCWRTRALPDVTLVDEAEGLSGPVQFKGTATRFGKNDKEDSGVGTPVYQYVQTCSEVFGVSLKAGMMKDLLGPGWKSDARRLTALVEVFNPKTGRLAVAPIVEVGPGNPNAIIDLTWAMDQHLGTDGEAPVQFRVIL